MTSKKNTLSLLAVCIGNIFENYDTALFALLCPFLAPQFFPLHNPVTALILTYAIIPTGMLMRPVGALFFGFIGDIYGRQKTLVSTLFGLSIVTVLMAFIPTYSELGILAPILFSAGKMLQNFFSAGETAGGAIYLIENTEEGKRNLMSGIWESTVIGGILLASMGVMTFTNMGWIEEGWRILFLLGGLTALFGLIIRLQSFQHVTEIKQSHHSYRELWKDLWERRSTVLTLIVASGFSYACYIISLVLVNGFVPLISHVTKEQLVSMNTWLLCFDFLTLPLFALLANRFGREKLMLAATSAAVLAAIPLFTLLENATLGMVIVVRLLLVTIGVSFAATFSVWSQQLVPPSIRCTVVGFSYAIGYQLLGGPTAAVSLWAYRETGMVASASWYFALLGLLTFGCIAREVSLTKLKKIAAN